MADATDPPRVAILGGCNGAGKTTASRALVGDILGIDDFLNADRVARGLAAFHPEKVAAEAGRIVLLQIRELTAKRTSFALETTLSGRGYVKTLTDLSKAGYQVEIHYFWLNSPELSIQRVARRVRSGGHNIPEADLRRRHPRSVHNFVNLYLPLADYWTAHDNSEDEVSVLIAEGTKDAPPIVHVPEGWDALLRSARNDAS